jgi:hypothetical protein
LLGSGHSLAFGLLQRVVLAGGDALLEVEPRAEMSGVAELL